VECSSRHVMYVTRQLKIIALKSDVIFWRSDLQWRVNSIPSGFIFTLENTIIAHRHVVNGGVSLSRARFHWICIWKVKQVCERHSKLHHVPANTTAIFIELEFGRHTAQHYTIIMSCWPSKHGDRFDHALVNRMTIRL